MTLFGGYSHIGRLDGWKILDHTQKLQQITNYEIFLKFSRCLGVFDFSALFKFSNLMSLFLTCLEKDG